MNRVGKKDIVVLCGLFLLVCCSRPDVPDSDNTKSGESSNSSDRRRASPSEASENLDWLILSYDPLRAGAVDASGRLVIEAKYEFAKPFMHGLAPVKSGGRWGAVDGTGRVVLPAEYENVIVWPARPGRLLVADSGKLYLAGTDGKPQSRTYDYVQGYVPENGLLGGSDPLTDYTGGPVVARDGRQWILLDADGQEIFRETVAEVFPPTEGFALVSVDGKRSPLAAGDRLGGKWGFVDRKGNWAMSPRAYDRVMPMADGMAKVLAVNADWNNGPWGFVNAEGKEAVPPQYKIVSNFSEGVAIVYSDTPDGDGDKWYLIDKTGRKLFSPKERGIQESFGEISRVDFNQGPVVVSTSRGASYMAATGEIVFPKMGQESAALDPFVDGLARIHRGEKVGLVDRTGRVVADVRYDEIEPFKGTMAAARLGDKWGVIDRQGQTVLDFAYAAAPAVSNGDTIVAIDTQGRSTIFTSAGREVLNVPAQDGAEVRARSLSHGPLILVSEMDMKAKTDRIRLLDVETGTVRFTKTLNVPAQAFR